MLLETKYFHDHQQNQVNQTNQDNQTNQANQDNKNFQAITMNILHHNKKSKEQESKC